MNVSYNNNNDKNMNSSIISKHESQQSSTLSYNTSYRHHNQHTPYNTVQQEKENLIKLKMLINNRIKKLDSHIQDNGKYRSIQYNIISHTNSKKSNKYPQTNIRIDLDNTSNLNKKIRSVLSSSYLKKDKPSLHYLTPTHIHTPRIPARTKSIIPLNIKTSKDTSKHVESVALEIKVNYDEDLISSPSERLINNYINSYY